RLVADAATLHLQDKHPVLRMDQHEVRLTVPGAPARLSLQPLNVVDDGIGTGERPLQLLEDPPLGGALLEPDRGGNQLRPRESTSMARILTSCASQPSSPTRSAIAAPYGVRLTVVAALSLPW